MEYFEVQPSDDGKRYEFQTPSLYNKEIGFTGVITKSFNSLEEANQIMGEMRKEIFDQLERDNFTEFNYANVGFEQIDGMFRVSYPGGLVFLDEAGPLQGAVTATFKNFATWDEARAFYCSLLEKYAVLTHSPILSLTTSDFQVNFSNLEVFDPQPPLTNSSKEVPPFLLDIIKQSQLACLESFGIYKKTLELENWKGVIFSFISNFLEKNPVIMENLKINNVKALTPKQAADLTVEIVLRLTKYNKSMVGEGGCSADDATVLDLLREGSRNIDKSDWQGNGICRHFAAMVKAVFESIKSVQLDYNMLNDMYCTFDVNYSYKPSYEKESFNTVRMEYDIRSGHAWNTFYCANENEVNCVIIDATWADLDPTTSKKQKLDYTFKRMEPIMSIMATDLDLDDENRVEELRQVFTNYQILLTESGVTDDAKKYYCFQMLDILRKQDPAKCSELMNIELKRVLGRVLEKNAEELDIADFEFLFKVKNLFSKRILKSYVEFRLSYMSENTFIVNDDHAQALVFDELYERHRDVFDKCVTRYGVFRSKCRVLVPEYLGDSNWDPVGNEADRGELEYLVRKEPGLASLQYLCRGINERTLNKLYSKLKEIILKLNDKANLAKYSDYELIYNFKDIIKKT